MRRIAGAIVLMIMCAGCMDSSAPSAQGGSSASSASPPASTTSSTLPSPVPLDRSCESPAASTVDLIDCAAKEQTQLTTPMNELLNELRGLAGERGHAQAVDDSQAAWRDYEQKACTVTALFYEGGSALGPAEAFCYVEFLEARIRQLQAQLAEWRQR